MQELINYITNFRNITKKLNPNQKSSDENFRNIEASEILDNISIEEFIELTLFLKDKDLNKLLNALEVCHSLSIDASGLNSQIYFLAYASNVKSLKGFDWNDISTIKSFYDKYRKKEQFLTDEVKIYEGKLK